MHTMICFLPHRACCLIWPKVGRREMEKVTTCPMVAGLGVGLPGSSLVPVAVEVS